MSLLNITIDQLIEIISTNILYINQNKWSLLKIYSKSSLALSNKFNKIICRKKVLLHSRITKCIKIIINVPLSGNKIIN